MYFYLKQPKSEKETLIIIQYYVKYDNSVFKFSTSEKINPKDWDFKNRMPISKRGSAGVRLANISNSISIYNNFLLQVIDNSKLNGITVTKELLKNEFKKKFKGEVQEFIYFVDFIIDFINKAPNLTNRNTGKKYSSKKIQEYRKVLKIITEFDSKVRIENFTITTHDKFIDYLEFKGYARNTVGDFIKNVKLLLKIAESDGYKVHDDLNKFSVIKETSLSIALREDEINKIFKHEFESEHLRNCRDLAIIGFWTGLRINDLLSLPKINESDTFITVEPKKTKDSSKIKVVIPLHHHIKEVILKRGMPRMISDVKFNKYIKKVCQEVGMDEMIEGSLMVKIEYKKYRKKTGLYPKYKLVSSHTCRRSFATNLYLMNFPVLSIMKITGHTTEKSFLAYIKVTPTEHAEKLLEHWNQYYNR